MGMGMGMGDAAAARRWCRAFTMIELTVCIGIIMILIGLLAPALGRARAHAMQTKNLSSMRGAMMLLTQYTSDNQESYPIGWTDPVNAAKFWYVPLRIDGYIESFRDLGIVNVEGDRALIALTLTALEDQEVFVPGSNRHTSREPILGQSTSKILFSAEKGILWQYRVESSSEPTPEWCCLPGAPLAPIAFADGHAANATYKQFDVQPLPETWLRLGLPVSTTWAGLHGRDILAY